MSQLVHTGRLMGAGRRGGGVVNPIPAPSVTYTGGTLSRLGQGAGWFQLNTAYGLAFRNLLLGGRGTIFCDGDSTTRGSLGSGVFNVAKSWPNRLAIRLAADGIPANQDTHFGAGGLASAAALTSADPRVTFPVGSWSPSSGQSLGGAPMVPTAAPGTERFTPGTQFNATFNTIQYFGNNYFAGTKTYTINVGGSTLATVTITATDSLPHSGIVSVGGTGTLVNLVRTAGQPSLQGVRVYNAANPGIAIFNCGRSGWKAGDAADITNPYSPGSVCGFFATAAAGFGPVAAFINFAINDWTNAGTVVATFKTNLLARVDQWIAAGVIPFPMVPVPSDPAWPTQTQSAYIDAIYEVAILRNTPLIDLTAHFVDYATANGNGFMGDQLHPSDPGYVELVDFIGDACALMVA